jgi:hypothetical protein
MAKTKTKKTQSAAAPKEIKGNTITFTTPLANITKEFLAAETPNDAKNSYTAQVVQVLEKKILPGYPTFQLSDVTFQCRILDLPVQVVRGIAEAYCEKLIEACRLEKVYGAYDEPVYIQK